MEGEAQFRIQERLGSFDQEALVGRIRGEISMTSSKQYSLTSDRPSTCTVDDNLLTGN